MRLMKARLCTIAHRETIKQLLAFLAGTKNYRIIFGGKNVNTKTPFIGFTDADFASDIEKHKYTICFLCLSQGRGVGQEKIPLLKNEGAQEM